MAWIKKRLVLWMALVSMMGVWMAGVQAASTTNQDLITATIDVKIDNPGYFWCYPFEGKQLDSICISGMGKTVTINRLSEGGKIQVNVPKDYKFRIYVQFKNGNSIVKEFIYATRDSVDKNNNMMTISLKAPDPQPVIVKTEGLTEALGK